MDSLVSIVSEKFDMDPKKTLGTIKAHIRNVTNKRNEADCLEEEDGILRFVQKEAS